MVARSSRTGPQCIGQYPVVPSGKELADADAALLAAVVHPKATLNVFRRANLEVGVNVPKQLNALVEGGLK